MRKSFVGYMLKGTAEKIDFDKALFKDTLSPKQATLDRISLWKELDGIYANPKTNYQRVRVTIEILQD